MVLMNSEAYGNNPDAEIRYNESLNNLNQDARDLLLKIESERLRHFGNCPTYHRWEKKKDGPAMKCMYAYPGLHFYSQIVLPNEIIELRLFFRQDNIPDESEWPYDRHDTTFVGREGSPARRPVWNLPITDVSQLDEIVELIDRSRRSGGRER